jgi:hypothetical protein
MPFPKFEVQPEIRIIPLLSLSFVITFGEVIVFLKCPEIHDRKLLLHQM